LEFERFCKQLKEHLNGPLPGVEAQFRMAPAQRRPLPNFRKPPKKARTAAVLALFIPVDKQPHLVLTERNRYPGTHSGQISFPGGAREPEDRSFTHTALRETYEEIGVAPESIEVLGALTPLYIPPSNFWVQPYCGICRKAPEFKLQEEEVARLLITPWREFNQCYKAQDLEVRPDFWAPAYPLQEGPVWGATAMMISELAHLEVKL